MDFNGILIILCLFLVVIYLGLTYRKERTKPELAEAITIIISGVGVATSIQLGLIAIFKQSAFIGDLADQRIPVLVGAFAVLWVSTSAIAQIYSKHYKCDPTVLVKSPEA